MSTSLFTNPSRRDLLLALASAGLASSSHGAESFAGRTIEPASHHAVIAQIFDVSPAQQDVSRDLVAGSQAAWQEINRRGGLRGSPVQHLSIPVDGSEEALRAALNRVRDLGGCLAFSGTAGDPAATQLTALLRKTSTSIAHVAPWLQNSSLAIDDYTFPIFAPRQDQIAQALQTLAGVGISEIGTVYATAQSYLQNHVDLERIAGELKLRLRPYRADGRLTALGATMGTSAPVVLLFVGGTPELSQFVEGVNQDARRRFVIALADVNLQTLLQMGVQKDHSTSIVATQPVPLVSSSIEVVRNYRAANARFFSEAPTALGLAGYIAARYTFDVLQGVDGPLNPGTALQAFQRRAEADVGGYRIRFGPQRRSGNFVTQSMLSGDGRIVG